MLSEALRHIFIERILLRQLAGDLHHVLTEHAHPGSAVRLLQISPRRQWSRAVEHTDVVEAEEAPLENVFAFDVLAVDPPGEVEEELLEDALQEVEVLPAVELALDLEDAEGRPGVDGRVDVTEVPFVAVKESVSRLWSVKAG